jgi:hypothetical protein
MEKEFIPYEQALALKELGFDEPCIGRYGPLKVLVTISRPNSNSYYKDSVPSFLAAPTFSQAFRWFREKYGFVIRYIPHEIDDNEGQSILHHYYKISEYDNWRGGRRNTVETELSEEYEEAELECLKKLIEIVKQK